MCQRRRQRCIAFPLSCFEPGPDNPAAGATSCSEQVDHQLLGLYHTRILMCCRMEFWQACEHAGWELRGMPALLAQHACGCNWKAAPLAHMPTGLNHNMRGCGPRLMGMLTLLSSGSSTTTTLSFSTRRMSFRLPCVSSFRSSGLTRTATIKLDAFVLGTYCAIESVRHGM